MLMVMIVIIKASGRQGTLIMLQRYSAHGPRSQDAYSQVWSTQLT